MSKDPAFLFYSSDFLTGTMFMDNEQVGKFIRLICAQHQKGRLTEKDMLKICGTHDEDIFSKFAQDSDGLYYNERLEQEVNKRKAYSESRRNNRKKKEDMNNISKTYVKHMENENENENINVNTNVKSKRFVKPSIDEIAVYMEERNMNNVSQKFYDFYEAKGWMIGKNHMKDWKAAVRTWESNNQKTSQPVTTTSPKYFNLEEYDKRH